MTRIHQKFWKLLLKRKVMLISLIVLLITLPIFFLVTKYKSNAEASWYDGNWSHRKQLTFNNSAQSSNLSNFPVMIKLTSSNFPFSQAKSDGSDIRFTDSNGSTLIPYEIESYDSTAQTATLWVNVPQIDSSSSTDSIYIYWGNPKASDAQSADNTWNSNYKGVYHLKDNAATTTVTDSSGNGNNLTSSENTNNGFYQSAGKVGSGFLTAGTPTYITNQSGSNISEVYPDIVLDSNGYPVIAYTNYTTYDLVLVHCNDKECKGNNETVSVVDSTNNTGYYPSIQLDSNGYPMIAYQYQTGLDLKYVHCNDVNCAGGNETFSVIETTGNTGYYPRMVKDGSGYPVIAYYYGTGADLKLVHCGNSDCSSGNQINNVDTTGTVGNGYHGTDIVLDGSGYPVISYYDTTNTELKVAHCNDVNCAGGDEAINSPVSTLAKSLGVYTSIELDGSNLPMIAYYNTTDLNLEFIHCDDIDCAGDETVNRIVVSAGLYDYYPSMEKNTSGNPVIVVTRYGYIVNAHVCANTNCSSSTLTLLSLYNQQSIYPNFKLDANNNIYAVTYSQGKTNHYDVILTTTHHKLDRPYDSDFDFGTGSFSVSTWFKSNGMAQKNTLVSRYDADQGFKLGLNYAGQACFEIDDDATWNPDDAACSSNSQINTNVDNGNATSVSWNSMILDASGYPVIAYFDATGADLEIIHCNDANCTGNNETFASIDVTGNVGQMPSLVLDGSGYPVISYYDATNTNLKIVHCGNANCSSGNTINALDVSVDSVGAYSTLKLDGSGYPVISYYDVTNTSVKLVHCNDVNCSGADESIVTLVNDEDDRLRHGSESLQLDASGYPMVVYWDNTNGDLKYIHCNDINCDGVGETKTTIETANNVGDFATMTLDSNGYPVIVHYDATNFNLRIVHCGNANCSSGNVANAINHPGNAYSGYYELDIKLNASGNPVILSYQPTSWSTILTVCNDVNCSGDNETHSIMREGTLYNYYYHSLALDSNSYPVIAYAANGNDLRLIHMTNGTTYTESGSYDDSAWHHMVAVKNGTSSISIYVDGVLVGSDVALAATGTLTGNSASLNLAEEITNSLANNNWTGYLDEVQIDNTARSADWVAAQYLSENNTFVSFGPIQTSPRGDNPIAYFKFDEGQGVVANNNVWEKTGTTINLIPNPSLEANTTGWIYAGGNGSLSRITTDRVYGDSSGSVIGATDYAWSRARYNGITASSSTTYTLSAYVKAGSAGAVGKTIILGLIGNNSGETTGGTTTLTNSWQRVSMQKTTNASDTTLDAEVIWNNNSGGDTFYFDGVQLELSNTANLYCDGSLSGNGSRSWSGTAHASTSTCDAGTDGQINSAIWKPRDQCINGKCLYFDGTGDNVEIGASKFDTLNNATIETWFKYTGTFDANRALWGHYKDATNRQVLFVGYPGGWGNKLVFENIVGGVNRGITSNTTLTAGNWYHAAISCGADGMKMYLNGVIQTLNNATTDCLSTISGTTYNSIGQASSGSMNFNGFIDDVKIFPYVRTPIQIKNDFNSRGSTLGLSAQLGVSKESSSALSNGLVGYWKMDETSWNGSADEVKDSSGNGNNGTAQCNSGQSPGCSVASTSNGKFGNSGIFSNASSQGIGMGDKSIFEVDGTNSYSGFAWIKPASSGKREIFHKRHGGCTEGYNFYTNANGTIEINSLENSTNYTTTSTATVSTDAWSFVGFTIDRKTNKQTVYVNGLSSGGQTDILNMTDMTNTCPFEIANWGPIGDLFFDGSIDDVRIYNRALSPVEVRQLYAWAPGLLAYYNFNEGSGVSAKDSSVNGLDVTWAGSNNHYIIGKYGKAANLPTTSDYAYSSNDLLNIGTNDFTISSWIKTSNGSRAYIIDKGAGDGMNGYRFETGTDFKLLALIGGPSSFITVTGSKIINDGLWHHVSVTFVRNGNAQIYVDGIPSGSPVSIAALNGVSVTNTSNFAIGSSGGGAGSRFIGNIDDVRIYNYARTPGQIVEDMNAGHPVGGSPVASQIGYWKFDEGYGTVANNSGSSGTSLIGTFDTNAPDWKNSGKFGKALDFTSANSDHIDIGDMLAGDFSQLTISAWIKPATLATNWFIGEGGAFRVGITNTGNVNCWHRGWNSSNADVNDQTSTANTPILAGNWYYVSCAWNGLTGVRKIYVNGIEKASGTSAVVTTKDSIDSNNATIGDAYNNAALFYNGFIDEVKIYSSTLTSDEIKVDYNRGSAMVLGTLSDTSGVGGAVGDSSDSSNYCVPGDATNCNPPIGEWKMDEGTSTVANDSSGNGNTGTITGATWSSGKIGKALNFNGSSNYVDVGNGSSVNITGAITLEAWVKPNTNDGNWSSIISKSPKTSYFIMQRDGNKTFTFGGYFSVSGYKEVSTADSDITLNQWQHIAATYDGSSTLKIFVNGVLKGTNATASGTLPTTAQSLLIGASTLAGERWSGALDQVRVFNYARTPAQIVWDYNRGGPVGHWKLDECTGTAANDSSGTGNIGTLNIGATGSNTTAGTCTGASGEAWKDGVTGKFNSSLEFDGTDDYVYTADAPSLDMGTMTVSAWIKTSNASEQCIVERNNSTFYFCTNAGKLRYWINGVAATWTASNRSINDNVWHHVLATWDGSNKKLYIDGKLDKTEAGTGGDIANAALGINIGVRITAGVPAYYFNGQIDDVRLFNYPLTLQQIKMIYNNGAGVQFAPITGNP